MKSAVFLGIINWHFRFQRPQRLAKGLAALGETRCLYVDPNFLRAENVRLDTSPLADNLELAKVWVPDYSHSMSSQRFTIFEASEIAAGIDRWVESTGSDETVLIVQHPAWRAVVGFMPDYRVVYDLMDYHKGFHPGENPWWAGDEEAILGSATSVIASSEFLKDFGLSFRSSVALIRNAASEVVLDGDGFTKRREGRPIVGYVGAVSTWFDDDLLRDAAERLRHCDFEIYGEITSSRIRDIEFPENVKFFGEINHQEVSGKISSFSVGIIPFRQSALIDATDPVKAYEYLSAGVPVVATNVPELRFMPTDLCTNVRKTSEFVQMIKGAIRKSSTESFSEHCRSFSRVNLWSERSQRFSETVFGAKKLISAVVLHYGDVNLTKRCLASLFRTRQSSCFDVEIVVVCNGTPRHDLERIRSEIGLHQMAKIVPLEENVGFSAGMNAGIRASSGEYLVLINNDTEFLPGSLTRLVSHLDADEKIGAVGPISNEVGNEAKAQVETNDPNWRQKVSAFTAFRFGEVIEVSNLSFFCVAMRRSVFDSIGELDEAFGIGMFEDDDYCNRIREAGLFLAIAVDSFVFHEHSANFKKLGKKYFDLFDKNKSLYEAKWGEWRPHNPPRQELDIEANWF